MNRPRAGGRGGGGAADDPREEARRLGTLSDAQVAMAVALLAGQDSCEGCRNTRWNPWDAAEARNDRREVPR